MARSIAIVLKRNWKQTWGSHIQRGQVIIGSVLMVAISCMLPSFFNLIQKRDGIILNDWVLAAIPAHNVSWAIFTFIWGAGFYGLWRAVQKPTIYITYIWSLIFILGLRVLAISLVALDPPKGLITLVDPLTGVFYGESNITKDLFFSGHTSILYLAYLCMERKKDKTIMLIATIAVACLLLVQHVHYTIDVVAAFLIVYPVNKFVKYLLA
ncbi:MAG TPA: phosphatase PAP2-related protein [Mucilaginibacter sp.]|nr:phosphatase PAP2-related protein [Mucilaginibacter sp.]